MKIVSLVFSPAGKSLETAKRLEKVAGMKGFSVRTIDWTRSDMVFRQGRIKEFLEQEIPEHDILFFFSPVYVHHLPNVAKEVLRAIPRPGRKWGACSIPVVTFGGGSSGIALKEAAEILFKTKRTVIAALKVEAEHCIARIKPITTKINPGKPGEEIECIIGRLIDYLIASKDFGKANAKVVLQKLSYQTKANTLKNHIIFQEKFWQHHIYPKLGIDQTLCRGCGACVRECSVQCLEMGKDFPILAKIKKQCIHCTRCITVCPTEAIQFQTDWDRWNHAIDRLAKGKGPLYTEEKPNTRLFTFID